MQFCESQMKHYRFVIDVAVDPNTDKNLDHHLKGAMGSRQQRRQLISAFEKSSTGDVKSLNMEIAGRIVSTN